jgi:mycofactocin precursor
VAVIPRICVKYIGDVATLLYEPLTGKVEKMEKSTPETLKNESQTVEEPEVIEEIVVEELSIDGVCGVY